MSKLKYSEIYLEYVLGQLSPRSLEEFDKHLKECEECKSEVESVERAVYSLPETLPQIDPSPHVRAGLLTEIRAAEPHRTKTRDDSAWKLAAAAAGIAAISLGALAFYEYRLVGESSETIERLEGELTASLAANEQIEARLDALTRPGSALVRVGGTEDYPQAAGIVVVDSNFERASVVVQGLPQRTDGLVYQLWILVEGTDPVPSITFDSSGFLTEFEITLPVLERELEGFATTIEPQGGSPQPTGAMVVVGMSL